MYTISVDDSFLYLLNKFIFRMDSEETGTCGWNNVQRFFQRTIKTSRYKQNFT